VAKYRRRVFDGDAVQRIRAIFGKVCAGFEAHLIEMDGEDDNVHLLVEYPSKLAVSALVNSQKGVSILFRFIVWRRSDQHHSPVHRTTANTALRATARTAMPSSLSFPDQTRRRRLKLATQPNR
jgi:REP element-mobilizing transposase RayT